MDKEHLLDRLQALMNLDYDAIKGYDKAIDDIENTGIREQLQAFRTDHERHVLDYKSLIRQIGGKTEEPKADLKGVFLEAMAAVQSKMGQHSALKACETAEKVVNSRYSEALSQSLPPDVRQLVKQNYGDEQRHLAYIQQALQREAAA